jgi:hypothetical protein
MSPKMKRPSPGWEVMELFAESLLSSNLPSLEITSKRSNSPALILYPDYSLYTIKDTLQNGEILLDMNASEEEFQRQLDLVRSKIRALEEEETP